MATFRVTMKDPDCLYESVQEAAEASAKAIPDLTDDEREAIVDKRKESFSDVASTWFRYGEYLVVEIDTDAKTCRVLTTAETK